MACKQPTHEDHCDLKVAQCIKNQKSTCEVTVIQKGDLVPMPVVLEATEPNFFLHEKFCSQVQTRANSETRGVSQT